MFHDYWNLSIDGSCNGSCHEYTNMRENYKKSTPSSIFLKSDVSRRNYGCKVFRYF